MIGLIDLIRPALRSAYRCWRENAVTLVGILLAKSYANPTITSIIV